MLSVLVRVRRLGIVHADHIIVCGVHSILQHDVGQGAVKHVAHHNGHLVCPGHPHQSTIESSHSVFDLCNIQQVA